MLVVAIRRIAAGLVLVAGWFAVMNFVAGLDGALTGKSRIGTTVGVDADPMVVALVTLAVGLVFCGVARWLLTSLRTSRTS